MVTLIPEGLILLVSVTYAAAALRMARVGRPLAAAERDRVARLRGHDLHRQDGHPDRAASLRLVDARSRLPGRPRRSSATPLGRFAASSEARNPTLEAVAAALPADSGARRRGRPVPLPAALERAEDRRRPLRARRAGALPARRARRRRLAPSRRRAGGSSASASATRAFPEDPDAGPPPLQAARARRARGGAPPRDARDDRVPPRAGRRDRRALRRLCERRSASIAARRRHSRAGAVRSRATALPDDDLELDRISRRSSASSGGSRRRASVASSSRCAGAVGTSRWSETASTTCPP